MAEARAAVDNTDRLGSGATAYLGGSHQAIVDPFGARSVTARLRPRRVRARCLAQRSHKTSFLLASLHQMASRIMGAGLTVLRLRPQVSQHQSRDYLPLVSRHPISIFHRGTKSTICTFAAMAEACSGSHGLRLRPGSPWRYPSCPAPRPGARDDPYLSSAPSRCTRTRTPPGLVAGE